MQNHSVITTKSLDIETIVITTPKLNKNKQLTAGIINSKTNSAVYIETPNLINPFGLSSFDGGKVIKDDERSWSIVLKAQGKGNEDQEDINNLFTYLKALDEKTIDFGITHSQTIFKKKYDESQRSILVDALYNRCVKPSIGTDGTVYPDKITLKVMKNEAMLPDILVFKDSPSPIEVNSWDLLTNLIPKGTPIKAIIQPRLYIVNGKFGINFRVLQIKLPNIEKVGRPITYAFADAPADVQSSTKEVEPVKKADSTEVASTEVVEETPDSEEEEEGSGSEVEVEEEDEEA